MSITDSRTLLEEPPRVVRAGVRGDRPRHAAARDRRRAARPGGAPAQGARLRGAARPDPVRRPRGDGARAHAGSGSTSRPRTATCRRRCAGTPPWSRTGSGSTPGAATSGPGSSASRTARSPATRGRRSAPPRSTPSRRCSPRSRTAPTG
ncbi:hypothetical protein [Nocardioides convexus]|uniref:hypothetical protein n=1 Tax=Nocardioides convexus TaxID=2712224 RepID=UPI0024181FF7|nr:hypothetical protein [Nocardioides convexus]